eukprot:SAG22_NODE_19014_length_279_cov_0.572222_1_plen_74_part_01
MDMRKSLLANVMLVGGNTCFEGMAGQLYKKLRSISTNQTATLKITAAPAAERAASAWVGGSVLASLSTFSEHLE